MLQPDPKPDKRRESDCSVLPVDPTSLSRLTSNHGGRRESQGNAPSSLWNVPCWLTRFEYLSL